MSTLGLLMSVPGQTMGVSAFTDYLIEALNLSRLELSTAYMLGTIASSFCLPWGGLLFDRIGARLMIILSSILLGLVLIYLSQSDRMAHLFYTPDETWFATLVSFVTVLLGFYLLRFAGQGMIAMTSRSMLGKWFDKRRGLASGISGVLVTFLFAAAPLIFDQLIGWFDWRTAWIILAGVLFTFAVVGWTFFRDNPEECGLRMDGSPEPSPSDDPQENANGIAKEFTLKEAQVSYPFWVFTLGLSAQAMIITAVTFHIVSIGESVSLSREEALGIFLPMAVVSTISNLIFGRIADLFELKYLLIFMLAMLSLGSFSILYMQHTLGLILVVLGFGMSNGVFAPLMVVVWPKFYGREHLGAISSLNLSAQVFASAIGPSLFGLFFELYESYFWGLIISTLIPLLIILLSFGANNPQRQFAPKQ